MTGCSMLDLSALLRALTQSFSLLLFVDMLSRGWVRYCGVIPDATFDQAVLQAQQEPT